MTPDWTPLRQELAIWQTDGRTLPLWWRDDDAVDHTPQLDQLTKMSAETGIPVHLAIIPKFAKPALQDALHDADHMIPVVHGWSHTSHAPDGQKNAEFGATRSLEDAKQDLNRAVSTLRALFPTKLSPMFVPPWNRIGPQFFDTLAALGMTAVSTYLPRNALMVAKGLIQINTHIDPIDWRSTRGLVDADTQIAHIVTLLQDRRLGLTDNTEPLGYLTHHLVHDPAIWNFSKALFTELGNGPISLYRHDEPRHKDMT